LNDVTLTMNKIVSPEIVGAIADTLRESAAQPQSPSSQASTSSPSGSPPVNQPASGLLLFIANLLSNTGLARFFGDGRPETAVLRGSLVGLASGVEAVTDVNPEGPRRKWRPLTAILTVLAYVVGGVAAALLLRAMSGYVRPEIPSAPQISSGS
jgi:hypothetical protein